MERETSTTKARLMPEPSGRIVSTYVLDAPRERVFEAYTDPKLLAQWWGPRRYTNHIERLEMRPGGRWRIVQRDDSGEEYGFHGVVHDVVRPERIVQTFEWEGAPGHVLLDTATFEELPGGRTRVTTVSAFQSTEDRDGMLGSGMDEGADESMQRLNELLRKG